MTSRYWITESKSYWHQIFKSAAVVLLLLMGAFLSPTYSQIPQNQLLPSDSILNNPNLPSNFDTQTLRQQKNKADELLTPVDSKTDPVIRPLPEPGSNASLGAPEEEVATIQLQELLISGVTVFEPSVLEEKFTPWIGQEVTFQDLLRIASEVTELYKQNGYVTTRAIVPPQEVRNGVVRIQVIEGKISDLVIRGNKHVKDGFIQARLTQKEGEVFHLKTLEQDIVSLNGSSLMDSVRATLKPGDQNGTSILELDVKDHFPIHLHLNFDNQGREQIGLYRRGATLIHENFFGFGDTLAVNVNKASGLISAFGQYRAPLGSKGFALNTSYGYSQVDFAIQEPVYKVVSDPLPREILVSDDIDVRGETHRYSGGMEFPILESKREGQYWKINGDVSATWVDTMIYVENVPLSKYPPYEPLDFVQTLSSGINISEQDRWGRTGARLSMTNGIGWLGGNTAFLKLNGDVTRVHNLGHGLIGILRAQTQLSPGRLPGIEQMQLGGANSVRGFREGQLIADNGYFLSGEVRFPLIFLPKKFRAGWQGLIFAEHGAVFINGPDDHPDASGIPGFLTSYGLGLRGQLSKHLQARVDFAMVGGPQREQPDIRTHFSLNSVLF